MPTFPLHKTSIKYLNTWPYYKAMEEEQEVKRIEILSSGEIKPIIIVPPYEKRHARHAVRYSPVGNKEDIGPG